jgi:hypothetical protein
MIINEQNAYVGLLWPENATMQEMQEIIVRMDNERQELRDVNRVRLHQIEKLRAEIATLVQHYDNDMQHWDTVMRSTAKEEEWCTEGTNKAIDELNHGFTGGYVIKPIKKIKTTRVWIDGNVKTCLDIHHFEGEDPKDPDNWVYEDGEPIDDTDAMMVDALMEEANDRGLDSWKVED